MEGDPFRFTKVLLQGPIGGEYGGEGRGPRREEIATTHYYYHRHPEHDREPRARYPHSMAKPKLMQLQLKFLALLTAIADTLTPYRQLQRQ